MCLLLQVSEVGDKHEWVDDSVVVKKHANDLTSELTVLRLHHRVDSVADVLRACLLIHLLQGVDVDAWDALRCCVGGLLARSRCLVHSHLHVLASVWCLTAHHLCLGGGLSLRCLVHLQLLGCHLDGLATSGGWLSIALVIWHATLGTVVIVLIVAVTVLILTSLAIIASLVTLVVVVLIVAGATGVVVRVPTSVVLHVVHASGHLRVEAALEVLKHLVVAALLTLLMQLLSGHPELDGEGTSTEGRGLIKFLDSPLSTVDVFVEDEVLAVGGIWIEVFALTELDGNNRAKLFEESNDLILLDVGWDVLDKQVRFISLAKTALNGVGVRLLGGNLVISL